MNGHLEGEHPQLDDLLTMVINHLLNGMILQALVFFFKLLILPSYIKFGMIGMMKICGPYAHIYIYF